METRLRIARIHGQRRFPLLFEWFRDDAEQTVWIIACSRRGKHMTIREFQRLAGRLWYAAARDYGFRRTYRRGNRQTGWFHDQQGE